MSPTQDACDGFVTAQYAVMLRAAYLLTGDRVSAQDLVQDVMVLVVDRWPRVSRADDPVAYSRRMLMNVFLAGRARRWRGEVPYGPVPDRPVHAEYGRVDSRDELRRGLLALPKRQRAAVVLRYYEQLGEAETAAVLGCSVGNVKSLTSRGLAALRGHFADLPCLEAP